ncbi:MAG TPA: DNA-processing protein DprA [Stellaceae bacterium]|nr:DNA-processing protein DprA [Stellaceae bacterium]
MPEPLLLTPNDAGYPIALSVAFGELASPEIWCVGNISILGTKAVGFCGSRDASDRGRQVAADCASQLSAVGVTIVSGYAAGVDMASHEAALAGGGQTIIVLPEGIDHFRIKKSVIDVWDWNRVLVVSQFQRNAIWRSYRAMERNNVIVALSQAVVVLEARDKGGTLHAGFAALNMKKPLFVAMYDEMNGDREGNQLLLGSGGLQLMRSRSTGQAQLRDVFRALGMHDADRRRAV